MSKSVPITVAHGDGIGPEIMNATLRILEEKGYLRHTKEGRAFVYHPVVDRSEASRSAVRHLLQRFFDNSPELLVLNVLKDERMDAGELKRLKKLIEESERRQS